MPGTDPFSATLSGFQLIGTFLSADTEAKNRIISARSQKSQALFDQKTALANADILNSQMGMFTTQQGEIRDDIREKGATVQADRLAMVAASGMGGAGTSKSLERQTDNRITRDINRNLSSMNAQNSIFTQQRDQTLAQAAQFGAQATFAGETLARAKKAKNSFLNPFD